MADRREVSVNQTDRPDAGGAVLTLPTVREVITLDAVVAGVPEVLVGEQALEARVRWVHASDSVSAARLLDGGELLLTTGSGWPSGKTELARFVAALLDSGLAGIVIELGARYVRVPHEVVESCREHGVALIVLHRETKFVAITEAVHSRIITDQLAALQARDEVRERFTALALRGSPADFIVQQLAQTIDAPVVLENLAHEVVAADVPPGSELELFADWESRSRQAHRGVDADPWLFVPVEARGIRWGTLVALPGPAHPAGRSGVLEQGAIALALGRLADTDDEWARIGRGRLLEGLLAGRFAGVAATEARISAAGLPVAEARLYGVVLESPAAVGEGADRAARNLGGRALAAPLGARTSIVLLSLPLLVDFDDAAALTFARAATGDQTARIAVGRAASGIDAALVSLQEATDLIRDRSGVRGTDPRVRRVEARPLIGLVTSLRDDHRLLEHGERMLAPLIEHDLSRGGDLLQVLAALLAFPGNRTAAAAASHLSRSVFYQRIALIGELLGVDLDDGETQTALHLALLVRRPATR